MGIETVFNKPIDDEVKSLSDQIGTLEKNIIDSSYQTIATNGNYTAPCDGYLVVWASSGSGNLAIAGVKGPTDNDTLLQLRALATAADNMGNMVFVRKGMRVFNYGIQGSGSFIRFYKLI